MLLGGEGSPVFSRHAKFKNELPEKIQLKKLFLGGLGCFFEIPNLIFYTYFFSFPPENA